MSRNYSNPWIPQGAIDVLDAETGRILDLGGAASPFWKADHIMDIQPYSPDYLSANAWGAPEGAEVPSWDEEQFTQFDVCAGQAWPFEDKRFDLAMCSHSLEDLRDPIPVVAEMNRVAKQILIICPSRLLEQVRGIEHPLFSGFDHHPWMVEAQGDTVVFRRKTVALNLPQCHLICPPGKTLDRELGSMFAHGADLQAEEGVCWSLSEDVEELSSYLDAYRKRSDLFQADPRTRGWRQRLWYLKQKYMGAC